jgi:NitT/TauT family transport system substrate-binding protein
MSLSRRKFTALAGAAAAATVLTGRPVKAADEAHTLKVRMDWLPSGYQTPFFLAQAKGWYQKAGLDVTIDQGKGSAQTVQLVGAGQYDAGLAYLAVMAFARAKGMPVTSIAGFFRKGDLSLLVPVNSPIKAPKDCKGKHLVYTSGSMETPFLDAWFTAGGLKRTDAELIQVDASAKISTYVLPTSDGVFTSAAYSVPVANPTKPTRAIPFADFGMNMPGFGIVANDAALKKKGDALKKFASITSGAWVYIVHGHHEDEAIDAMMKAHANDKSVQAKLLKEQLEASLPFLDTPASKNLPIGVQAESDWADAIKVMEKAKTIDPGSKPKDYYTNAYLDLNTIKSLGSAKS